jgi:two-component system, LytTR family, response regulator
MFIKCLIVDDEPPAREVLKRYVEDTPGLELRGECANAVQALGVLQRESIDLIFLDIRMPQLTGVDFLKSLKNTPKIVFTTAYSEYALEGYELDIVDYLMKPVRFERFLKAINKAFPLHNPVITDSDQVPQKEKRIESFVYFRADRKMVKVLLSEIVYIESMKDYVKVITDNQSIITKQSISSVETMLPEKKFIRTHRSFIVSVDKIRSFTNELIEIGETEIPIGKLYRNTVLKLLE